MIFLILAACHHSPEHHEKNIDSSEWKTILSRGTLIAATDFNSINYFIFNGRPRGFQYELLQYFARSLNLRLVIVTPPDLSAAFEMLQNHECDIIARNLFPLEERKKTMAFSSPILHTRQVLVQQKEIPADSTLSSGEKKTVRRLADLEGTSIFVPVNSSFVSTLKKIADSASLHFSLVEVPVGTEKLLEMVSRGDIDYTACDELTAMAYQDRYPNLDFSFPLTPFQYLSWGLRKSSPVLLDTLNKWIAGFKKTIDYMTIFSRYYKNTYMAAIVASEYYSVHSGKISAYDEIIKKYSKELGWDWRIIASMIYFESKFKHDAESHKGAFGIMQLMPETARRYGVNEKSSSEAHIRAGIRILKDIYTIFSKEIRDSTEAIKFTLAAYNIGIGHIRDAQTIARKTGKNPYLWDNHVAECLLLKSKPEYYNDPDIRFGYCVGQQTVSYVNDIMDLYIHYSNAINQ